MRKYANEAAFSKHLCQCLVDKGYFVQRIETRLTGRGVPDLYVGTPSGCYWIELKRIHSKVSYPVAVPWRPGQQRWMYKHLLVTKVPCFTIIAFDNCAVCVCHNRLFTKDVIRAYDALKVWVKVEDIVL